MLPGGAQPRFHAGEQDQPLHHPGQVGAVGDGLVVQPQRHARRIDERLALHVGGECLLRRQIGRS